MDLLFDSGNLAGILGLALIVFVGLRQVRLGQLGGWVLATGAALFLFSRLFRMYGEPLLVKPIHLTFDHFMITLVTSLPAITLSLGFVMIPLGLVLLSIRSRPKTARPLTYESRSLGIPLLK